MRDGISIDRIFNNIRKIPVVADLLKQIETGKRAIFQPVDENAQPFVAAMAARGSTRNAWIICKDVRSQEDMAVELAGWSENILLFPEMQTAKNALPDAETESERIAILQKLAAGHAGDIVVVAMSQLEEAVAAPEALKSLTKVIRKGAGFSPQDFARQLLEAGYEGQPQIFGRGQYSLRGGILDVFSWQHALPVRMEFFGDEVESLREFELDSQISLRECESVELILGAPDDSTCALQKYIHAKDLVITADAGFDRASVAISSEIPEDNAKAATFYSSGFSAFGAGDFVLDEARRERLLDQLREWLDARWHVTIFCNNEGESQRLHEILAAAKIESDALTLTLGGMTRGFVCPDARIAVLSDAEIFGRAASQRARRTLLRRERSRARVAAVNFGEFEEDDLVVHIEHGIGRYAGLQKFPADDGVETEVLVLEFAENAKLFVPLDHAWKVSRYIGLGRKSAQLSQLGDAKWQKQKRSAEKSIAQYAASLIKLHAERAISQGNAFSRDTEWQKEFEGAFLFQETPDQLRSTTEIKQDMETARPMDRLLCGDVGFGKTEVAIRAAFKAVMDGKQVAVLAPTTVLSQQHFETFRERMSDYPVTIELLSRYRTRGEQTQTIARLLSGEVDIVIGTHRLISKDVRFKDLGLVVVDEEQRFGVQHKERLKERFRLVDVLTLSATPIPRTLYMALMGARDMSVIETPPPNRLPVETVVCAYDERVIRDAIQRELARGGQVYFLHNRVRTIDRIADRIRQLCPKAKVDVGHGQMEEGELEDVMKRFLARQTDVLVATTIIESGLDIPNANTIIIDRADRFGLADLYQLRGRVGRGQHKAYAYLLLPRDLIMLGEARKRVSAIKQYSELGSGFKIAMRDLEIRGAGNLLGNAQSGHVMTIGFDLYCRMLKRAIAQVKGEQPLVRQETILRLDGIETEEAVYRNEKPKDRAPSYLPLSYISQPNMRIDAYRRLVEVESEEDITRLSSEWRDRFGPLPGEVENLLEVGRIRLLCSEKRVEILETKADRLMISKKGDYILIGGRFPRLTSKDAKSRLREIVAYLQAL